MTAHSPPLLLDVSRLIWRGWSGRLPTGIDRTCLAYAAHYRDRALAVVQRGGATVVLDRAASSALFYILLTDGPLQRARLLRLLPRALLSRVPARRLHGALYLNVGHTGLNTAGHTRWIGTTGVKPVYFVHDLIPLSHPEYCRPGEPEKHNQRMRTLLSLGTGVIGNSAETISVLTGHAQSQRLPIPATVVAPLGVPPVVPGAFASLPESIGTPPLSRPYFVMLGTIEGRKNHVLILNIWRELAERHGMAAPQLVIIGQRGWESEQAVDMLDRCEPLRHHVIELGRCNDALLARYMRHARALLFPSFVEGYGLPLVEALALGTPVIASRLSVFQELVKDIPDYLSPIDGLGWMERIKAYAEPGSSARAGQIARMEGYAAPGWNQHFVNVDGWLETLAKS
ncbi:glycosyltransferase family 4 protein [Sphingobium subterraneum]|uniref:Glycosyltransferase involved in cell wall biosynthesis n=1 Tax=Sphingobium subterraneum TaxID=627688 RepID=A0A841IZI1_9SPHN|nr:glycosyltransferase family 1 protein [Sphingobium subterraneum]MBB6123824.1 glycosyltransferase involved in cell wall biosynthesis [Sphingobium subterraneum]